MGCEIASRGDFWRGREDNALEGREVRICVSWVPIHIAASMHHVCMVLCVCVMLCRFRA